MSFLSDQTKNVVLVEETFCSLGRFKIHRVRDENDDCVSTSSNFNVAESLTVF